MPNRNKLPWFQRTLSIDGPVVLTYDAQPKQSMLGSDYSVYALMYQRGLEHCIATAMAGPKEPDKRYVVGMKANGAMFYVNGNRIDTGFDRAERMSYYDAAELQHLNPHEPWQLIAA